MESRRIAMTIDRNDPRLRAAELSEQEFTGTLEIYEDTNPEFLDVYPESSWTTLPVQPLIEARDGYELRYKAALKYGPLVFLVFKGELMGVFHGDTLLIDPAHRGKHLSRELILAGFAQSPWKNPKDRKVTKAGQAALRSAHAFIWQRRSNEKRPREYCRSRFSSPHNTRLQ